MVLDALNLAACSYLNFFPPFLLQELGRPQVCSRPRNSDRDDPGHLSVSNRPVGSRGPAAAASAGASGERDRLPAGPPGGAGHVGHNVCLLPPQEGGAVLWHQQV